MGAAGCRPRRDRPPRPSRRQERHGVRQLDRTGPPGPSYARIAGSCPAKSNPAAVGHPVLQEIDGLLNLRPGLARYEIIVAAGDHSGPVIHPDSAFDEVRVEFRSTSQVYFYLANGVEVPAEHIAAGLVKPAGSPDGAAFDGRAVTGSFTVHSCAGHRPPPTAFVAVKYRDYWYYVDDRDSAKQGDLRPDARPHPPGFRTTSRAGRASRCQSDAEASAGSIRASAEHAVAPGIGRGARTSIGSRSNPSRDEPHGVGPILVEDAAYHHLSGDFDCCFRRTS